MSNEAPDLLVEITARHQVYLERIKAGEFKKYDPFLKRIAKLIKSRLNSGDYGEWTRTELNKQLRSVNRDIKLIQGEYIQDFEKSSLELAQYEAGFEARSLEQAVKYDFDLPTETQLKSAIMTNPLQAKGANGKLLMPFVKDMTSNQINNITNAIRAGVYQGLTTDQIVKNIIGTKVSPGEINKLYKDTRLTVHTGLQHVSVQAREETWKRNKSVVKEVQWSSTLDEKTSTICRTLDHQKFPVDEGPRPPAHINACLKGTLVNTKRGQIPIENVCVGDYVKTHTGQYKKVYIVMAREHNGKSVDLKNNFGGSVSLTCEHPILTRQKGWVEAGDVKAGDEFFNNIKQFDWLNVFRVSSFVPQAVLAHSHNIITSMTQELVSYGIFSKTTGMSSAIKLNNGVVNNKIRVISKNSILGGVFGINAVKYGAEKSLMFSRVTFKRFSKRVSAFFNGVSVKGWIVSLHSYRVLFDKFGKCNRVISAPVSGSRLRGYINHIIPNGLAPAFQGNAILFTKLSDSIIRKPMLTFNQSNTFIKPVMMYFNNVFNFFNAKHNNSSWLVSTCISIVAYNYRGMVYNLAVDGDETYIANGFVVHNCRSSIVAALPERWEFLREGATRSGRDEFGKVTSYPADMSYYEFLKRQSAKYQDSVIGPSRGKLLRDGGLTSERFAKLQLNKKFEPITLDEMRELEPLAFAKMEHKEHIRDAAAKK